MKHKSIYIFIGILALIGAGAVAFYFLVVKKPVDNRKYLGSTFSVDSLGNVTDSQNVNVGTDNGDGSFTTPTGTIYDYNGNVIGQVAAGSPGSTVKPGINTSLYNLSQYHI